MGLTNVIIDRYVKNGEFSKCIEENKDVPYWMLTPNGKKIKKYSDETIETFNSNNGKNQIRKNFVESTIAKLGMDYCGRIERILSITGPNIKKHIEMYLWSGFAKIMHVAEINQFTYLYLMREASKLPEFYNHMLNLHFASAEDFKVDDCKFIDLDLMQTYKKSFTTIAPWLQFQAKNIFGKKAFTFTVGIRTDGGSIERFNHSKDIFRILGADLKSVDGKDGRFPSCKEYAQKICNLPTRTAGYCYSRKFEFNQKGRIENVVGFSYADGSPMLCILVLYQ